MSAIEGHPSRTPNLKHILRKIWQSGGTTAVLWGQATCFHLIFHSPHQTPSLPRRNTEEMAFSLQPSITHNNWQVRSVPPFSLSLDIYTGVNSKGLVPVRQRSGKELSIDLRKAWNEVSDTPLSICSTTSVLTQRTASLHPQCDC